MSILLNTHLLVPPITAVQYYDGVACVPRPSDADITGDHYVFTPIWVIFGGLVPLTISIVVPIVVLCYVRRNTIAEGSSYNKGIAKFALFLIAGNLINFISQTAAALITHASEVSGMYVSLFAGPISLIATPIMILIFMKPVRAQVTKMCCVRLRSISLISKLSLSTNEPRL